MQEVRDRMLQLVHSRDHERGFDPDALPAFFGGFRAGRNDAARRTEEILAEGYGQDM